MTKYLLFLYLYTALANAGDEATRTEHLPVPEAIPITAPSLTAVLSNIDVYLGTKVTVFGFLYGNSDTLPALFISEDHAMHADYSSSVIVENAKEMGTSLSELCGGQYVRVTGTLVRVEAYSVAGTGKPIVMAKPSYVTASRMNKETTRCWPPSLAF
jgi:hypothetical protein